MDRPESAPCCKAYRMIQAHCAIRLSTKVGSAMRSMVGPTGEIYAMTAPALSKRFHGAEYTQAIKLLELAIYIKKEFGRGGSHEQANS